MNRFLERLASKSILISILIITIIFNSCEQQKYVRVCGVFNPYTEEYCRLPLKPNAPYCHQHTAEWAKRMRETDESIKRMEQSLTRCWYRAHGMRCWFKITSKDSIYCKYH